MSENNDNVRCLIIESDRMIDKVEVSDCFGRIVFERNGIPVKRINISFTDFPTGIYLLNMVCEDEVIAKKVVKQ